MTKWSVRDGFREGPTREGGAGPEHDQDFMGNWLNTIDCSLGPDFG